jgi:DNA-binding beta-propeller fold protein YncE
MPGKNLYVADTGNNTIRKMVMATGAVTTLTQGDIEGGLATDGTNLYMADFGRNVIMLVR